MTPILSFVTALIRMLGLYFFVQAVDTAAGSVVFFGAQMSALPTDSTPTFPNPWLLFLFTVGFYLVVALVIFFKAPALARLFLGGKGTEQAEELIPWSETMIFCTGMLLVSWGFIRLIDNVQILVPFYASTTRDFAVDNAMLIRVFLSLVVICLGVLLIAKFHRISVWMGRRRAAGERGDLVS